MGTRRSGMFAIDDMEVPGLPGRIGVAACPGMVPGAWHQRARRRDLEQHVDAIRAWGAAAVVTLLGDLDLLASGVAVLPAALVARGVEWHHLPLDEVDPQARSVPYRWPACSPYLRAHLRRGGNVLIHDGIGLDRALDVSRRLRDELIAGIPSGSHARAQPDRIAGCLVGMATGDAIGRALLHQADGADPPIDARGQLAAAMFKGGRLIADRRTGELLSGCAASPAGAALRVVLDERVGVALAGALIGSGIVPSPDGGSARECDGPNAWLDVATIAAVVDLLVGGAAIDVAVTQALATIAPAGGTSITLATALHDALAGETFVDAMRRAGEHDRAAVMPIVGCIKGAEVGLASIPHGWMTSLELLEPLLALLHRR